MRLFHLDPEQLSTPPKVGDRIKLDPGESRHLLVVNRVRVGDIVHLADGAGHFLESRLLGDENRQARLEIIEIRPDPLETSRPDLVLACGIIKGKRFEWVLEKAVELGVHSIVPLLCARSEVDPRRGRLTRWSSLLRSAMKQSGRSFLPRLEAPLGLAEFLFREKDARCFYGLARSRDRGLVNDMRITEPADLFSDLSPLLGCASIAWLVGPEGGWDPRETVALDASARALRLGPYRLRTETAVAAGLSLLGPLRESLISLDEGVD